MWSLDDESVETEMTKKQFRFRFNQSFVNHFNHCILFFFSAYRTLYFWKNKKKKKNNFRKALPSCLGTIKFVMYKSKQIFFS